MNCSSSHEYEFECKGSVKLSNEFSYCGETLYTSKDANGKPVNIPSDLYRVSSGSVSYHDKVTVTHKIDGKPFEKSVSNCRDTVTSLRGGIDALTSKVVDLNKEVAGLTKDVCKLTAANTAAAVSIAGAKETAANTIADSLSSGFSHYIGYLIRERLTELEAQLPNTVSTFKALSVNLARRREVLGRDYDRISERYAKLFQKLNEELKRRLLELDRPAFENCAQMQASIFTNPFGYMLGESVCAGAEQLQVADAVRVSRLKETTAVAMEVVKGYVKALKRLSASVRGALTNRKVDKTRTISMPIVRLESDDLVTQAKGNVRTFMPQWFESSRSLGFGNAISDAISEGATEQKSTSELAIIDTCFMKRFSNWAATSKESGGNSRVAEKILALWKRSKDNIYN